MTYNNATKEGDVRIYLVQGTTGEYSDRMEWPVRAFTDYHRAELFALACKQEADKCMDRANLDDDDPNKLDRWRIGPADEPSWPDLEPYHVQPNPLDPNMRLDYTGTEYFVAGGDRGIELEE